VAASNGKPLAVVVGGIGKLPLAGVSLYVLHHVVGLQELGYEVHYVERQNRSGESFDPDSNEMTDDTAPALTCLRDLLPRFSIGESRFSFVDLAGVCHGSGWAGLETAVARADFVLTIADPTWFDVLELNSRRAYIDGDPVFTQIAVETGVGSRADAATHYDVLFSYGTRIGEPDCTIPDAGRRWLPARPVVATSLWNVEPAPRNAPVGAILHWAAGSDVEYEGLVYGHKDREFVRVANAPARARGRRFVLALGGGGAQKGDLRDAGWELTDPLEASRSLGGYQAFVRDCWADLGVAKHAYVVSRSGWFSDRSTCYLAAGRPVLHQDTGYTDWLDVENGVLPFSDSDSLAEALERLEAEYERHMNGARRIAEEHFEARTVLASMLEEAGFR
jgi:hypothetical protein